MNNNKGENMELDPDILTPDEVENPEQEEAEEEEAVVPPVIPE